MKAKDIFYLAIIGLVSFYFLTINKEPVKDKVTVNSIKKEVFTPSRIDSFKQVIPDTVRLKPTRKQIDSVREVLELKYKDSISILNALINAKLEIKDISKSRNYTKTYNTNLYTATITEKIKGYLENRDFNIKLKPQKVTYTEKNTTIEKFPKFSLWFGSGLQSNFNKTYIPLEISIQPKNGDLWDFSYSINPLDIKQSLIGVTYKKRLFTKY